VLAQVLVGNKLRDFWRLVSVSYTALILAVLFRITAEVWTFHPVMIFAILGSFVFFAGSIPLLSGYYDLAYVPTAGFAWKTAVVTTVAIAPVYIVQLVYGRLRPPSYRKIRGT